MSINTVLRVLNGTFGSATNADLEYHFSVKRCSVKYLGIIIIVVRITLFSEEIQMCFTDQDQQTRKKMEM